MLVADLETKGLYGEILGGCLYDTASQDFVYSGANILPAIAAVSHLPIYFHNAAYDYAVLLANGIRLSEVRCTMALAHLHQSNHKGYSLSECGDRYCLSSRKDSSYEVEWSTAEWNAEMEEYCRRDVLTTAELLSILLPEFSPSEIQYYESVLCRFIPVLGELNTSGISVDTNILRSRLSEWEEELLGIWDDEIFPAYHTRKRVILKKRKAEDTYTLKSGFRRVYDGESEGGYHYLEQEPFNPSNANHLSQYLFEQGWRPDGYREGEKIKTDKDTVFWSPHPLLKKLQRYRSLKIAIDVARKLVKRDGRCNPSFSQTGTATGRLNSWGELNGQNIGSDAEFGMQLRAAIVPRAGYSFIHFDLSNIEARVLADIRARRGDLTLASLFESGGDFHSANAAAWVVEILREAVPDWSEEQVLKMSRKIAKTALFASVYGGGAGVITASANKIIGERIFDHSFGEKVYSRVKSEMSAFFSYVRELIFYARRDGYTLDLYGRRLYYPALRYSNSPKLQSSAERQIGNAAIQGLAGSILKIISADIWEHLREFDARFVLSVHDEILLEALTSEADRVRDIAEECSNRSDLLMHVKVVAKVSIIDCYASGK